MKLTESEQKICDKYGERINGKVRCNICPFCGGMAELKFDYSGRFDCDFTYVKCCVCGAQSKSKRDSTDRAINAAINAWNLRNGNCD